MTVPLTSAMRGRRTACAVRRCGRAVVLLCCLPTILVGLLVPPSAAASHPWTRSKDAAVQAALDAVVASGVTGVVAYLDDGSRSWEQASGLAALDPPTSWRRNQKVRVGSLTKTFVATIALQLAAEGRLRLDDSVERWLPGLVPNGAHITVRELLQHTSGLYNYTDDQTLVSKYLSDPFRFYSARQVLAVAFTHPPLFPPGTSWSYSNTGYRLVGMILERVTGQSLRSLLRTHILKPLHLRHTMWPTSGTIPGKHAHGYLPPDEPGGSFVDVTDWNPVWAGAAGALIATVGDLHNFLQALLSGRLLRPASLAQMTSTVTSPAVPGSGYGLGLFYLDTPCGRVWGHTGDIFGYETMAFSNASGTHSVVLAANTSTETSEAASAAMNSLLAVGVCRMLGRPGPAAAPLGS